MAYHSLVLPHFYFAILARRFESELLLKLQMEAIRTVHRAKYNAHTKSLMKESGLLDLKDIFDVESAKFYYKFKHGTLPLYFETFFGQNNQIHSHFTRNGENLHKFQTNRSCTNECICHYTPTLIKDLPTELKPKYDTHSLSGFTNGNKRKLLGIYPMKCLVRNCNVYGHAWYQIDYLCELIQIRLNTTPLPPTPSNSQYVWYIWPPPYCWREKSIIKLPK